MEAPPLFPPTFLYNSSWEDPEKDMKALRVGPGDACLTLTSGGCNALNLCLQVAPLPPHLILWNNSVPVSMIRVTLQPVLTVAPAMCLYWNPSCSHVTTSYRTL